MFKISFFSCPLLVSLCSPPQQCHLGIKYTMASQNAALNLFLYSFLTSLSTRPPFISIYIHNYKWGPVTSPCITNRQFTATSCIFFFFITERSSVCLHTPRRTALAAGCLQENKKKKKPSFPSKKKKKIPISECVISCRQGENYTLIGNK